MQELDAELEQQGEAERLEEQLEQEEGFDDRLGQEPGLDRDEEVAPFHETVDDAECRQPAQRAGEGQARAATALERDGQAHDEEDLTVDGQDDDAVRLEQLREPAHGRMVGGPRSGSAGEAVRSSARHRAVRAGYPLTPPVESPLIR